MSELPTGWTSCCIAEMGGTIGGKTPSKANARYWMPREIPWASPKDMKVFLLRATEDKISNAATTEAGMGVLPPGSVLMVTRSGILAHTFPVAIAQMATAINQDIKAVLPNGVVTPRFLAYALRKHEREILHSCTKEGTTVASVETDLLERLPLPLAPLPEQKRIADKLDALLARVDACRAHLDRVPAILKRFRQSVLAAATTGALTRDWREENRASLGDASSELVDFLNSRRKNLGGQRFKELPQPDTQGRSIQVPESWTLASVAAVAECLDARRVPIKKDNRARAVGRYPYYGANGQVDLVDDYLFDDELVLVTEDETFYGRTKPIAYRSSGRCWVNNHAHVLRPKDALWADYLCYSLMYRDVAPWLTGTTGRAKLTQAALNALPIAVPPYLELVEIVRRVRGLLALAEALSTKASVVAGAVERLTPSVLSKAFRGELVPQDPNDEPASALLARLKTTANPFPQKSSKRRSARQGTY